jgi:hypothetical protein
MAGDKTRGPLTLPPLSSFCELVLSGSARRQCEKQNKIEENKQINKRVSNELTGRRLIDSRVFASTDKNTIHKASTDKNTIHKASTDKNTIHKASTDKNTIHKASSP